MVEIVKNGKIVARSQNLRGILRYATKQPVTTVVLRKASHGRGLLDVGFYDGASSQVIFADYTVLQDWVTARRGWPQPLLAFQDQVS